MATAAVVRRGQPRWFRKTLEWTIAVCGAILIGAASVSQPLLVMLLVVAATLVVVAFRLTSSVVVLALLTLAYLPESIVGGGPLGRPELQKGFLFFAVAVMMAARGV